MLQYIPMTVGQKKPKEQLIGDARKAFNLDQRLKALILSIFLDDQMNSVINLLTAKSTWDDLLYHEGPSDMKESRVMELKLCYNTFKFKEGLVAEAYEWDKEDVSSDDNQMSEVKILMVLANDESITMGKESARNRKWVKITMKKLSEAGGFTLPKHDISRILLGDSQVKITGPSVSITDSSAIEYDAADESLVCSTPLPLLEKLAGAEPVSGPKTIKLILKSNSTFKAKTLKGVTINKPSSVPAKGNKKGSASKNTSAPVAMKIQRISTSSAQEIRNDQFLIRRITLHQYAICTAIRNLGARMLTRAMSKELSVASAQYLYVDFLSEKEPKKTLVPLLYEKTIIGSKWVFRNKRDETGIVIKKKAKLVDQGYNQQEGIDYDETFTLVARIKAIRIFFAFATYMNFTFYQMDMKSSFLNGKLEEEVYGKQPLGFKSSKFLNHVCKLDKALYRLKQAPRAWTQGKCTREVIAINYVLLLLVEVSAAVAVLKNLLQVISAARVNISVARANPQVVSAAKLPILNPNEFDLWKMRIEKYFLMTDYSLWEVILNGDSHVPTRIVEGVIQPVASTTAKQKLARKNELKSCGTTTQNLAFMSSSNTDSTTNSVSAAASVSVVCAKMHVSSLLNVDSLSNAVIYSFFDSQSTSLQLDNKDLKQIDVDDLEKIDLRWHMAMLTMREKRFLQKTGQNLGANGPTSMGFDMSKVECYKCHRKGHFARECRSPKDSRRNGAAEPQRRTVPVETSTSNALVSQCDGVGSYDWSYQAEEEPANFALMDFLSSSSSSDTEAEQYDWLADTDEEVDEQELEAHYSYMAKIQEVPTADTGTNSEPLEQPPTSLYDRFQPSDGYHAVPPPYTRTFMPPKPDLVFNTTSTTVETDHPAFTVQLSPTKPKQALSHTNRPTAPIIVDWVSDSEDEYETKAPQIVPSFVQSSEQVKSPRHSIKHVETSIPAATPKPASPKSDSSGKRKNRKACFVCKSMDHLIKDCDYHAKRMAQPTPRNHAHRVLTQSKPVSFTVVRPISTAVPKIKVTRPRHAHSIVTKSKSPIRRHITHSPSPKTSNSPPRITAVKALVVSSAQGNPQHALKDKGVINSGYSRHMTGNMSYLSDFEELNGGYVAFGGNSNSGKISGKGKIKSCKLDFDDVYFVKELKFNLFSVSQMCDKKNSVFFTDTEYLVLSPDFKLSDESQVLLRVPRENNMNNVNLKNTVPSGDLTCLFAKATLDESNLWHRRLAHINFKTINKLVKANLVRGLPTKVFKNDNTCVACKKGKQHRASCKTKPVSSVDQPLYMLHMDLFGPTFVNILNKKSYCLVVTDDYSSLTRTMNYQLVTAGNQTNPSAGFQDKFDAEKAREEIDQKYMLFPVWYSVSTNPQNNDGDAAFDGKEHDFDAKKPESKVSVSLSSSAQSRKQDDKTKKEAKGKSPVESFTGYRDFSVEFEDCSNNSINEVNTAGTIVPTVGQNSLNSTNTFSAAELEDITYSDDEDDVGAKADSNNLETSIIVSPILTTRVHKDHPVSRIIGDLSLTTQTRSMTRVVQDQGGLLQMFNDDFNTYMFACFLSQEEPKRKVWILVDLPHEKRSIGTKWVFRNKKDERGIVVINKARVVAQGHTQEEGIDYEEVFAPVARIEAIRLFLAYASFMGFMVYQIDVKSAFLYETIEEEVYVCQPPGFEDPNHPDKVYKVVKALYGLHQAPRAWYETFANYLLVHGFQRGKIDQTLFIKRQKGDILLVQIYVDDKIFGATNKDLCKSFEKLMKDKLQISLMGELTFFLGLQVKQKKDGIFISQDKYVAEILRKFGLTEGKSASTPIDTEKPLLKDPDGEDVDVHTYRLISWKCKKKTVVATSSTEAEYVAAASCCAQVPWIQNQLLDYGDSPLLGVNTPRSDEDRLELMELMVFLLPKVKKVRIGVNAVDLQVNDVTRLQALVDRKKVVVQRLRLEKHSIWMMQRVWIVCPMRIFLQSWLEWDTRSHPPSSHFTKLSSRASGNSTTKFYMYPRFLQLIIRKQVGDLSTHTTKYALPALTQKIFENIRRVGKGFSGIETPLFEGMLVEQEIDEERDADEHAEEVNTEGDNNAAHGEVPTVAEKQSILSPTPPTLPPQPPQDIPLIFLIGDLSTHTTKYASPALTQKVFTNMRRVGKGFSRIETPLFEGMLIEQEIDEEGDADEHVEEVNSEGDDSVAYGEVPTIVEEQSIPSPTPPTLPPQPPQDILSTSQVQHTPPSPQSQPPPQPQQAADFPISLLQEAIDAYADLNRRVEHLEYDKIAQTLEIKKLKRRRVETSNDTVMDDESNQGRMIAKMDQDDAIVLKDDKAEDKDVDDAVKDAKEAKVVKNAQVQGRQAKSQAEIYKIDMDHANKVLSMQEDKTKPAEVQEVVDVVTTAKLFTEVVTATNETVTAASTIITTVETQVPAATTATLTAAPSRRRKGVTIKDPKEKSTTSTIIPTETKSKDKGKGILVEEPKPLKKKQQIEQDEKYARELHAELNKDIDWNEAIDHVKLKAKEDPALDYFKGMSYDDIRPIFKAMFNSNVDFLLKTKEQIEEEENRALQTINETPAEKAAKRRKLNEEIKGCLDSGLSTLSSLEKLFSELIHGILTFSGSQYLDIHPPSQETSNEVFRANHSIQNEESFENSSNKIAVSNSNQDKEEPAQDFDMHQLIEECSTEICEEQKQSMKDTMLELVKSVKKKSFFEREVKNVTEQQVERENRSIQSLQNFRVVHKSSISLNTSQISSIHAIAPILSTKEPEHSLSMGYEHLSITPETESDKVTESNAENLLPIPSECEVTLEDEIECDMPANDDYEINSDKLDPHCFNVESDCNTFIDSSSKFDFSGELAHVNPEIPKSDFDFEEEIRLIKNLRYDNSSPRQPEELNAEIADTIVESIPSLPIPVRDGDSQREEIDIFTETDDVLPLSVENDDDSLNDSLLEEADLFLSDNSIPPGIENFADNPERDIRFLEELLIDDSIFSHESSYSNFEDNPLISRPPPEPSDVETDAGEEIPVAMNNKDEDVDYSSFIFIFDKMSSLLSVESEDTIFDPGISD
nr:putative ribonuclease H-like domain-containing protein [Tanacetum cinerariifolium]